MTMESDLTALLLGQCAEVSPDFAPTDTPLPYVTYQVLGGPSIRSLDGAPLDKRQNRVQINAYCQTREQSKSLIRSIEDAMCATSVFTAAPEAEPYDDFDADMRVYWCIQDFLITSTR